MRQVIKPHNAVRQNRPVVGSGRYCLARHNGFTLIELLVVIAIASILLLVAAPSFFDAIQRTDRSAAVSALADAIAVARSEALGRGTATVLCSSTSGSGCTDGAAWHSGFLVADTQSGGVIQVWGELPDDMSAVLDTTGDTDKLFFQADGMTYKNSTYVVCDSSGATNARGLVVAYSGMSRIAVDSSDDGQTIEAHGGGDVTCPST